MVIVFLLLFFFFPQPLIAEDNVVTELTNQINQLDLKLLELSRSKDTLNNQIKYLDTQYSLTELKIRQTEASIVQLQTEIADLTIKIKELDVSLNQLTAVFIEQINQNYRLNKRLPYISILFTGNFNHFFEQYKYLTRAQKSSQDTLLAMETARSNLDTQKQIKSQKQKDLSALETKLEAQKKDLGNQKNSKLVLLTITRNDEARYRKLKTQAETELSSLLAAKFVGSRKVTKGEALGLMGNSGYSFGDHLHFGLYNLKEDDISTWSYFNDIDAFDYLKNHVWPMNSPIEITQERGRTKYSYLYADRFHHGIDIVSTNKTVRTVENGVAYFYLHPSSSLGNHVKVFHPDGKMTLYLHLQ